MTIATRHQETSPKQKPAVFAAVCFAVLLAGSLQAHAQSNETTGRYYRWPDAAQPGSCEERDPLPQIRAIDAAFCGGDWANCRGDLAAKAFRNQLPPTWTQTFTDFVSLEPGQGWLVRPCVNAGSGVRLHLSGIGAMALMRRTEVLPLLDALAEHYADDNLEGNGVNPGPLRTEVVRGLFWLNASDRAATVARLVADGAYTDAHRGVGLRALAMWNSDAAVSFCSSVFTSEGDNNVKVACGYYLGWLGNGAGEPFLIRNFDRYGDDAPRLLGLTPTPGARAELERRYAGLGDQAWQKAPYAAALMNHGSTQAWNDLRRFLAPTGDDLRTVIMETVNVRPTAPKSRELNAALRGLAESRTLDAQARLYAAIALAQRGDLSQVPAVIAALNGSESGLRENALEGIGGRFSELRFGTAWGRGVVADERLIEPLLQYHAMETDLNRRRQAIEAAATIRVATQARGGQAATATVPRR